MGYGIGESGSCGLRTVRKFVMFPDSPSKIEGPASSDGGESSDADTWNLFLILIDFPKPSV